MTTELEKDAVWLSPARDMDAVEWGVLLRFNTRFGAPEVVFIKLAGENPERHAYSVTSVLESAAFGGGFGFGHGASEKTIHRFSHVAISLVAAEAAKRTPGTVGRFEVRFAVNNPNVPF